MLTSGSTHGTTMVPIQLMRTVEAARTLGITPMRLRDWESRFGFPTGRPGSSRTREFSADEVLALRAALTESHSVPRAVDAARAAVSEGPARLTPLMLRLAR